MGYNDITLKKLFALSGNICAFPACSAPIVDTDMGIVVGEICHIKGNSPNGPRYDAEQTELDRNAYENLMLMCGAHNKIVDDIKTRNKFPVELLMQYKADHEGKYRNSVVDDHLANSFVAEFHIEGSIVQTINQTGGQAAHIITNYNQPVSPPQITLTPLFEWRLTGVTHPSIDSYDFRIALRNDGSTTVRDFRLDIDFPNAYLNQSTSYGCEIESRRTPERRLFRVTPDKFANMVLYPGDSQDVFAVGFQVTKAHYIEGISDSVSISIYRGDDLLSRIDKPIADMLNRERLESLLENLRIDRHDGADFRSELKAL
jgi:hypothetical protein